MHDHPPGDTAGLQAALRASEARYRALAAASAHVVYRMSPDWSEMRQLDGLGFLSDTAEPSGSWLERYIHPDDRAQVTGAIEAAVRGKTVFELEHRVLRADGTLGWTVSRAVPILDADGETVEWVGVASDVTARREAEAARKEAEAALRESERRYRLLFENMGEGFALAEMIWDDGGRPADWRYLEVNDAWAQTGVPASETVGRTAREVNPEIEEYWIETYGRVVRTGEPVTFEAYAEGFGKWFDTVAFKHSANCFGLIFRDVTERKQDEADLRASEARYRTIFESIDEGFAIAEVLYDGEGRPVDALYLEANPAASQLTGVPDYSRRRLSEVMPGAEPYWVEIYDRVARTGAAERLERYLAPIGRWYDFHVSRVSAAGSDGTAGAAPRLAIVFQDVTARRQAEAALRESEEKYRNLFEWMGQGYSLNEVVRDAAGAAIDLRYLELNPAFERLTGASLSEARGRLASEVFPGLDRYWVDICDRAVRTGVIERVEHELTPNGRWYQSNFYPIGRDRVLSLYDDITDRKRAEIALRRSEERQAFLLRLSDALRAEPDADAVADRAIRMLIEHMRLDRSYIVSYRLEEDRAYLVHQRGNDTVPPLPDVFILSDYPAAFRAIFDQTLVIEDELERQGLSEAERQNSGRLGMRAMVGATLRKGEGRPHWSLVAISSRPRSWTRGDIALVEEVAERTWAAVERARAEAALRESEARYHALFAASPVPFMVLAANPPDFTITAANAAYFAATLTTPGTLIGRRLFEVFPDDPSRPGQLGSEALAVSLDRVLTTRRTDRMARVRYDLVTPHGFEPHWWVAINAPLLDASGQVTAIIHQVTRVTELHLAEEAERQGQERQSFLLELSDQLRAVDDPAAAHRLATHLLGEFLAVDQAFYYRAELTDEGWAHVVEGEDYHKPGIPLRIGRRLHAEFGTSLFAPLTRGETVAVADIHAVAAPTAEQRANYASGRLRAFLVAPVMTQGRYVAGVSVQCTSPRDWTARDVAAVQEAAERTWAAVERTRALAALRASEEKYRTVFESMDEGFLIHDMIRDESGRVVDYRLLEANPAHQRATGLPRETIGKLGSEFMPHVEQYWLDLFHRVSTSGVAERAEMYNAPTSRWYNVQVSPVSGHDRIAIVFDDVTARKQAETALKASEERQAFLLTLSDALRSLADADAIQDAAARVLGEHLGATRAMYAEVEGEPGAEVGTIRGRYLAGDEAALGRFPDRYDYSAFGERVMALRRRGETMVVADVATDPAFDDAARAAWIAGGVRAAITVALVKGGRFVADFGVQSATPRSWTADEVALVEETAARTWAAVERARAEAALRASEEQFRRSIEEAPIPVVMHAEDGEVLQVSRTWTELTGWTLDEVPTFDAWLTHAYGEGADAVREHVHALFSGSRRTMSIDFPVRTRGGELRHWSFSASAPGTLHDGRRFIVGMALDVTERRRAEEALREREERLRLFGEASSDVLWMRDAERLRWEYLSPAFERIYGYRRAEVMGPDDLRQWADLIVPEDRDRALAELERVRGGERVTFEYRVRRADGEVRTLRNTDFPIPDASGRVGRIGGIGQDVTEEKRREANQALLVTLSADLGRLSTEEEIVGAAGARLAARLKLACYHYVDVDEERGEVTVRHFWHALDVPSTLGTFPIAGFVTPEGLEMRRAGLTTVVDDVQRDLQGATETVASLKAGAAAQKIGAYVAVPYSRDGRWKGYFAAADTLPRRWTAAEVELIEEVAGRVFPRIERVRAEAAVRELNETLEQRVEERTAELTRATEARREVLQQLVTAEEDERRRISRELHDSLGQLVTGLLLGLKALPRDGQTARIEDLERLADRIAREMQHMAVRLRPPALDNLGLRLALQAHMEEWSQRYGIECDFHAVGVDGERFAAEVETTVYRSVQEGLNNVAKHAGATRVSLVLERRGGVVATILEDDGRGFDVEATLASPEKARRLGLRGMRERVALLGGELEIESAEGAGTTLYVRIPLLTGAEGNGAAAA
jgi:PAS domain S-box-containing protein